MFARFLMIAGTLLALTGPAHAGAAFRSGGDVRLNTPMPDDLVTAGGSIALDAPVDGDVLGAAFDLRVTSQVGGDAVLAAFDLSMKGPVSGDLVAAAFDLTINSDVSGDAILTGTEIALQRGAHVAGDLKAEARELTLSGQVDGDAVLTGDLVVVEGRIMGDLEVSANRLELRPGAEILGDLRHTGPQSVAVPDGVDVGGTVRYHHQNQAGEGPTLLGTLGKALALFLLGVGVLWLLPGPVTRAADAMRRHPLRHLLLGTALLLLSPLLLALLMVSVVGIPLGLLLLGLWLLCVPLGIAVTGFGLALIIRRGPARSGTEAAALMRRYALAVLVLALISLVPVAGIAVLALAASLGVGALAESLLRGRRDGLALG